MALRAKSTVFYFGMVVRNRSLWHFSQVFLSGIEGEHIFQKSCCFFYITQLFNILSAKRGITSLDAGHFHFTLSV